MLNACDCDSTSAGWDPIRQTLRWRRLLSRLFAVELAGCLLCGALGFVFWLLAGRPPLLRAVLNWSVLLGPAVMLATYLPLRRALLRASVSTQVRATHSVHEILGGLAETLEAWEDESAAREARTAIGELLPSIGPKEYFAMTENQRRHLRASINEWVAWVDATYAAEIIDAMRRFGDKHALPWIARLQFMLQREQPKEPLTSAAIVASAELGGLSGGRRFNCAYIRCTGRLPVLRLLTLQGISDWLQFHRVRGAWSGGHPPS